MSLAAVLGVRAVAEVTFGTDPRNHDDTPLPPRPGYLQSYIDPDFHTRVTRITDSTTATDGSTNDAHGVKWGNSIRNHYRTIQPWNADMSLLLLQNEIVGPEKSTGAGGHSKQLLLDGSTYAFKFALPFEGFDFRWHPKDPHILFYTLRNELRTYDFSRGESTLLHAFTRYPATQGSVSINNSNFSADGRWIVLHAAVGKDCDFFVYDTTVAPPADGTVKVVRFSRTKIDQRTGTSYFDPIHPWATMTPSGNAVVMFWNDAFSEVYDRSFNYERVLEPSGSSHYDIACENGKDFVVGVHKNPGKGGLVYKSGMDGSSSALTTVGFAGGTSARNLEEPGWAYVTYEENGAKMPLSNEIDAIDIDSNSDATIRRIAHSFNGKIDYVSEVHAVPSPDGKRVLFQSNWGNRGGNGRGTDTYVADLRDAQSLKEVMVRVADRAIARAPLVEGELHTGDWAAVKRSVPPKTAYWSYTTGVDLLALQRVYALTHEQRFLDYATRNNELSAEQYGFLRWQMQTFGTIYKNGGFGKLWRLSMLDDCGAMGAEILDTKLINHAEFSPKLNELVDIIGNYVTHVQSRLPDGTFWRPESPDGPTIWADDLYMGVPFLLRWGQYRRDPSSIDDAARQIVNFAKYLQDKDGVFFHAYFVKEHRPNGIKWGRANGWAAVAMADVLSVLPTDDPRYASVLEVYRKLMAGLKTYQADSGLWQQVIDHPELHWGTETSCSAEFLYAMARGLKRGWLDESYRATEEKALAGLRSRITPEGHILSVCKSTSIGRDLAYYDARPKVDDDEHGFGTVLLALTEASTLSP